MPTFVRFVPFLLSSSFPASIFHSIIKEIRFAELFESLSENGQVDKNTLLVVLMILSTGEMEERLSFLFKLISSEGEGSQQFESSSSTSSSSKKAKEEGKVTRASLADTGQLAITCLVMMNLSLQPLNKREFQLAMFDPQTIMLVGRNHMDRAISDVCDAHLLASYDDKEEQTSSSQSLVDFDEFVQICLNVFYNVVESSSMKILETPLRSRSDPVLRRFTEDGLDSTVEERLQRRISNAPEDGSTSGTPNLAGSRRNSKRDSEVTPGMQDDLIARKSYMDLAEEAADAAADEARDEEGADHEAEPASLAGLIQDFGLRLFFLGGVRFSLALVFLAANGSLILVLVNRFDYTVEVALGFALLFDLGIAILCFYLASRLKKLENNLALLNEGDGEGDLGDLPEEIDSIVPGGGKLLASSLGFFTGQKYGGGKKTPRKNKRNKKEGGGSLFSSIRNFFGGKKEETPGTTNTRGSAYHSKNSSKSFTEMDFTPYKGQSFRLQGRHSRQPSAELL